MQKPQIRLPDDDGPNPYDSKTPLKQLGPAWLRSWQWWFTIVGLGIALVVVRLLTS